MLKIAYHPIYKHPLQEGHRFPMIKYELLPEQLLHEGTCIAENFFTPEIPDPTPILAVHDAAHYKNLCFFIHHGNKFNPYDINTIKMTNIKLNIH